MEEEEEKEEEEEEKDDDDDDDGYVDGGDDGDDNEVDYKEDILTVTRSVLVNQGGGPPRQGTSPTWGPPPSCEQALRSTIKPEPYRVSNAKRCKKKNSHL